MMCRIYKFLNNLLQTLGVLAFLGGILFGIVGILFLVFYGIDEQEITYLGSGFEYLLYIVILITYGLSTILFEDGDIKDKDD